MHEISTMPECSWSCAGYRARRNCQLAWRNRAGMYLPVIDYSLIRFRSKRLITWKISWADIVRNGRSCAGSVLIGLADMHPSRFCDQIQSTPSGSWDMLQKNQRSKVEAYGGEDSEFMARLFIVSHACRFRRAFTARTGFDISGAQNRHDLPGETVAQNGIPFVSGSKPKARAAQQRCQLPGLFVAGCYRR